ncbi:unnamed protein product, partial [Amoebophrya sp. A120]|eukprot:GSA120T00012113001.1
MAHSESVILRWVRDSIAFGLDHSSLKVQERIRETLGAPQLPKELSLQDLRDGKVLVALVQGIDIRLCRRSNNIPLGRLAQFQTSCRELGLTDAQIFAVPDLVPDVKNPKSVLKTLQSLSECLDHKWRGPRIDSFRQSFQKKKSWSESSSSEDEKEIRRSSIHFRGRQTNRRQKQRVVESSSSEEDFLDKNEKSEFQSLSPKGGTTNGRLTSVDESGKRNYISAPGNTAASRGTTSAAAQLSSPLDDLLSNSTDKKQLDYLGTEATAATFEGGPGDRSNLAAFENSNQHPSSVRLSASSDLRSSSSASDLSSSAASGGASMQNFQSPNRAGGKKHHAKRHVNSLRNVFPTASGDGGKAQDNEFEDAEEGVDVRGMLQTWEEKHQGAGLNGGVAQSGETTSTGIVMRIFDEHEDGGIKQVEMDADEGVRSADSALEEDPADAVKRSKDSAAKSSKQSAGGSAILLEGTNVGSTGGAGEHVNSHASSAVSSSVLSSNLRDEIRQDLERARVVEDSFEETLESPNDGTAGGLAHAAPAPTGSLVVDEEEERGGPASSSVVASPVKRESKNPFAFTPPARDENKANEKDDTAKSVVLGKSSRLDTTPTTASVANIVEQVLQNAASISVKETTQTSSSAAPSGTRDGKVDLRATTAGTEPSSSQVFVEKKEVQQIVELLLDKAASHVTVENVVDNLVDKTFEQVAKEILEEKSVKNLVEEMIEAAADRVAASPSRRSGGEKKATQEGSNDDLLRGNNNSTETASRGTTEPASSGTPSSKTVKEIITNMVDDAAKQCAMEIVRGSSIQAKGSGAPEVATSNQTADDHQDESGIKKKESSGSGRSASPSRQRVSKDFSCDLSIPNERSPQSPQSPVVFSPGEKNAAAVVELSGKKAAVEEAAPVPAAPAGVNVDCDATREEQVEEGRTGSKPSPEEPQKQVASTSKNAEENKAEPESDPGGVVQHDKNIQQEHYPHVDPDTSSKDVLLRSKGHESEDLMSLVTEESVTVSATGEQGSAERSQSQQQEQIVQELLVPPAVKVEQDVTPDLPQGQTPDSATVSAKGAQPGVVAGISTTTGAPPPAPGASTLQTSGPSRRGPSSGVSSIDLSDIHRIMNPEHEDVYPKKDTKQRTMPNVATEQQHSVSSSKEHSVDLNAFLVTTPSESENNSKNTSAAVNPLEMSNEEFFSFLKPPSSGRFNPLPRTGNSTGSGEQTLDASGATTTTTALAGGATANMTSSSTLPPSNRTNANSPRATSPFSSRSYNTPRTEKEKMSSSGSYSNSTSKNPFAEFSLTGSSNEKSFSSTSGKDKNASSGRNNNPFGAGAGSSSPGDLFKGLMGATSSSANNKSASATSITDPFAEFDQLYRNKPATPSPRPPLMSDRGTAGSVNKKSQLGDYTTVATSTGTGVTSLSAPSSSRTLSSAKKSPALGREVYGGVGSGNNYTNSKNNPSDITNIDKDIDRLFEDLLGHQ